MCQRKKLTLDLSEKQAVAILNGGQAGEVQRLGTSGCPGESVGEKVRDTDIARLACSDDCVEGLKGFIQPGLGIVEVKLV